MSEAFAHLDAATHDARHNRKVAVAGALDYAHRHGVIRREPT